MPYLLCGSDRIMDMDKENKPITSKIQKYSMLGGKGLSQIHQDIQDMESITLVIKRGKAGYGFSVTGSNPVCVRRIEQDSVSYLVGLRKDDCIMRINGQNVSHSIADNVAKIVRQSERQIVLDIQRIGSHVEGQGYSQCEGQQQIQTSKATRQALSTISEIPNENIPEENKVVCKADIEPLPKTSSCDSLTSIDMWKENLIDIGDWDTSKMSFPPIQISYQELSDQEQERQSAIQKLLSCEEDFLNHMHFGIDRYCSPLRHSLVSPAEHNTLFQNVEKLVAISEYHVYKLQEEAIGYSDVQDEHNKFMDSVGSIYLPRVLMMAEVFEQYCNGIKNAFRLLAELKEFEEFEEFLKEHSLESRQPTIRGFIQKPLEHIKNVVLSVQKILSLTPLEHQDTDNLTQVVDSLRTVCNRVNESNTRRSRSMISLVSRSSSRSSTKSSRSRASESSSTVASVLSSDSSSSSIESCVDPEVLEVQQRLVFCEHVQSFQLATATRHMIYAGELMHVDGLLCTKLYVVLMSDLLMLTRLEPDDHLLVVDYPLLLQDIEQTDYRTTDTCDFCLSVGPSTEESWVEPRDITLRAPSMEQKYTWKNILEHRIKSNKLQQEFIMNFDNFV